MFENLTKSVSHIVCLIWKFSRGGWRTAFLPGNTKWRTNCYRLCSSINNAHFKEFWILILQYNNSLRAPWKTCTKIEPKSKCGSKESGIEPNGDNLIIAQLLIVTPLFCINLGALLCFVSVFPFYQYYSLIGHCSSPLVPFLCCLPLHCTITTVEALWGHHWDVKKVSLFGAGRLQEWFSV